MPLLRPFNKPPFFSVDEVLDFMKQTLEVCALSPPLIEAVENDGRVYRLCIEWESRTGKSQS